MYFNYNGTAIHYQQFGKPSSCPTLLLHGWGRSSEDFKGIVSHFSERNFIVIDFPPFGKSDSDIEGWTIFTYAQMVISLCEHLGITKFDVLGHSFGGRIAILLCAVNRAHVHSCILTGSAGMKPKRNLKYLVKICKYKIYKKLGKDTSAMGSADYKALSPQLKKTFVNIVQTNLEAFAKTIYTKTLLIWGKKDDQTPLYMAKRLEKYLKNCKLEFIENGGHFAFLEYPMQFYRHLKQFWEEE